MSDPPPALQLSSTAPNGAPSDSSASKKQDATKKDAPLAGKPEPSGAEKKKLAKQEKAARRQKERGEDKAPVAPAPIGTVQTGKQSVNAAQGSKSASEATQKPSQHARSGSTSAPAQQQLPVRRRPSQSAGTASTSATITTAKDAPVTISTAPASKPSIPFYAHLTALRPNPSAPTHPQVHPAIATLAHQYRTHILSGSHCRTLALLLSLKTLLRTYTTPHGTSLPRHMSSTFLSPQLTHIKTHGRPLCTAQSAAIRWLKNTIATLDPSLDEEEAKSYIGSQIDTFIKERFTVADQVIATEVASRWISDGDVVVVYGKSVVVTRCLREAVRQGRRFRVIAVDSRPLHEGRAMAQSLRSLKPPADDDDDDPTTRNQPKNKAKAKAGIETTLVPLPSLPHALTIHPATKCILGAHTLLSNGAIQARAGTALVALAIKSECPNAPVLVAAESVKCSERVIVDGGGGGGELGGEEELVDGEGDALGGWRSVGGLSVANLRYDVTPAELVDVLVTEVGSVAPRGAAVIGRIAGGVGEGGVV